MKPLTRHEIASLADIQQIEYTPFHEWDLPNSTYDLLKRSAQTFKNNIALRFLPEATPTEEPVTYTYEQLFQKVTQTANAFHRLGISDNNVVSMLLPNIPETHFTIWGAEAAGIFNPINPLLDVEHIAGILHETRSKVLVTLAPMKESDLWEKAEKLRHLVPSLAYIVTVTPGQKHTGYHLSESVLDFNQLISAEPSDHLVSGRTLNRGDIASLFHTGGTTGTPKLAPHTHENELACCLQVMLAADFHEQSVSLCGLPLFHVNAVFITGLALWLTGGEVILATAAGYRTPAVIQNFWALVERYRITFFSCVPTILSTLLDVPVKNHDLSSLEVALCGAAPLATELMRNFEKQTGIRLLEAYGQTEGSVGTTCNPKFGDRRVGSVGLPLPYVNIRIVEVNQDGEYIRDCAANESGCVVICGPNVFSGYNQPEQNTGQWVEKEWFNTGDIGRLDDDGYLWLTGRSKDLIIRGGHNIDPQMIEEAFFKHPAVMEAVAIGRPDKRVGELPIVYLQLKPSAEVTLDELHQHASQSIHERAAIPKEIHLIEHIPVTAVGKVFKPALRDQATQALVESELEQSLAGCFSVSVEQDKQYGQHVHVICEDKDAAQVNAVLEAYTFKLSIQSPVQTVQPA